MDKAKIAGNFPKSANLIRCDFSLSLRNENNDWNFKKCPHFSLVMLPWTYCRSHSDETSMRTHFCAVSFRPEPSIRGAGQKDRGSEDEITALTTNM